MIGGIHGDEYASVSVVFKWMDILNVHHSGLFHWHFIPLSNPDGLLRKKSQRQNENGVDLNRNFPTAYWEDLSDAYWTTRTGRDPRRYPGLAAASEPETAYLVKEIEEFQPDIIISMHAPYGLIHHDGPPKAPERLGKLALRRSGAQAPGHIPRFPGKLWRGRPGYPRGDRRADPRRHHADAAPGVGDVDGPGQVVGAGEAE